MLISGNTDGQGDGFGVDASPGKDDLDGYITKIDMDGDFLQTKRIQSVNQQTDWVSSICQTAVDNDHVYVVGYTEGIMQPKFNGRGTTAFLSKLKDVQRISVPIKALNLQIEQ